MFFFQYFILGGIVPVVSLYLKELPLFSGFMVGVVLSMTSIASVTSPLIAESFADRLISSERLFACAHIINGILLIVFRQYNNFIVIVFLYLLITISLSPTATLLNILVFHRLNKEGEKFGFIRVWGTVGWISMAFFFSYIWLSSGSLKGSPGKLGDVFYIASAVSILLGLFSLTLSPASAGKKSGGSLFLKIKNLPIEGDRKVLFTFFIISTMVSVVDKYYYLGIAPFLKFSGFSERSIMPVISAGLISELIAMFVLYKLLKKYGYRKILSAGITAEFLRFTVFALAPGRWIIAGILLHGLTFTLYSTAAFIFLDSFCSAKTRSTLHLLFSFVVAGGGNLAGNLIGGILMDFSLFLTGNYMVFWIFPAIISGLSFIILNKKIPDENNRGQVAGCT